MLPRVKHCFGRLERSVIFTDTYLRNVVLQQKDFPQMELLT